MVSFVLEMFITTKGHLDYTNSISVSKSLHISDLIVFFSEVVCKYLPN